MLSDMNSGLAVVLLLYLPISIKRFCKSCTTTPCRTVVGLAGRPSSAVMTVVADEAGPFSELTLFV